MSRNNVDLLDRTHRKLRQADVLLGVALDTLDGDGFWTLPRDQQVDYLLAGQDAVCDALAASGGIRLAVQSPSSDNG